MVFGRAEHNVRHCGRRTYWQVKLKSWLSHTGRCAVVTDGFIHLVKRNQLEANDIVGVARDFSVFTEDNDPNSAHDFGSFTRFARIEFDHGASP